MKEQLFELTVRKVSSDPAFIACHLKHIEGPEKLLGCPRLNYLRLALCLMPKTKGALKSICSYAQVDYERCAELLGMKTEF
jgi:hypothetical protein